MLPMNAHEDYYDDELKLLRQVNLTDDWYPKVCATHNVTSNNREQSRDHVLPNTKSEALDLSCVYPCHNISTGNYSLNMGLFG